MVEEPLIAIFSVLVLFSVSLFARCGQVQQQKKSAGAHREECAPAVYYLTRLIFLFAFFAIFEK